MFFNFLFVFSAVCIMFQCTPGSCPHFISHPQWTQTIDKIQSSSGKTYIWDRGSACAYICLASTVIFTADWNDPWSFTVMFLCSWREHFLQPFRSRLSLDTHETYRFTTSAVAESSWRIRSKVEKFVLTKEKHVQVTDSVHCTWVVCSNHVRSNQMVLYGNYAVRSLCVRMCSLQASVRCNPGSL